MTPTTQTDDSGHIFTTDRQARLAKRDLITCFALFAIALIVYLKTLCPTIFADDCGEIATAVATGGVMHPPGYPLYTLIGGLFIKLIGFGEPAWRLGLLSALSAAFAVPLTYKLTRRLGAGMTWSVTAALAFAFSVALWQQATKVETYALNALFVTLLFNQAAKYNETGARRDLLFYALLTGFSLTNHVSMVCAIAGTLWIVAGALKRDPKPVFAALAAIPFMVAPLSLYALIWVAAASHPGGQIWGDPSDPHRFWLHVTGARYRPYMFSQSGLDMAQRDLVGLPATLWHNMDWFLVAVVPGVARALWSPATRRIAQALLIAASAYLFETSAYGILNIFEYYTPLVMILCVFSGVGMDAVVRGLMARWNAPRSQLKTLQVSVCCLVGLTAILTHWAYCDRSHALFMRNLAINTLANLPPNAVIVSRGDNRIFPMWYVQDVLGVRQDVAVIPRSYLASYGTQAGRDEMGWLVEKLSKQQPSLVSSSEILARSSEDPSYISHELPTWNIVTKALSQGRPVFMTDVDPRDIRINALNRDVLAAVGPDLTLTPMGLADQIVPDHHRPDLFKQVATNLDLEQKTQIDMASPQLMEDEPDGAMTNSVYAALMMRNANLLIRAGDRKDAYVHAKVACELDPSAANYAMLATLARQNSNPVEQIQSLKRAVALDGNNEEYQAELFNAEKMASIGQAVQRAAN